jgi:hypothetical protein
MKRPITNAIVAGALALGGGAGALAAGTAASAGQIACTVGSTAFSESTGGLFLGAANNIAKNPGAVFKPTANATSKFLHCDNNGPSPAANTVIAFMITQGGKTYALTARPSSGTRVTWEAVPASGPTLAQSWAWSGANPLVFHNEKFAVGSGNLRAPNAGAHAYGPVVVGAHASQWTQA